MHKLQVLIIIDLRYFLLALKLIFSKIYRFTVINAKDLSKHYFVGQKLPI